MIEQVLCKEKVWNEWLKIIIIEGFIFIRLTFFVIINFKCWIRVEDYHQLLLNFCFQNFNLNAIGKDLFYLPIFDHLVGIC